MKMTDSKKITSKKMESFLCKLADLVESLPTQESKDKTNRELVTLINFLSEFQEKMKDIPTIEETKEIASTIEKLVTFVKLADSDPFLSRSFGLSSQKVGGQFKRSSLTNADRSRAKEIAGQIKDMSSQDLNKELSDKNVYKVIFLKQIASEIGIKVDSRATRASIIEKISKKISNTRGYEYLRTGKAEARLN